MGLINRRPWRIFIIFPRWRRSVPRPVDGPLYLGDHGQQDSRYEDNQVLDRTVPHPPECKYGAHDQNGPSDSANQYVPVPRRTKRQKRPHRRKDEEPHEKFGPVEPGPGVVAYGVVAYGVVFIHSKSGIPNPAFQVRHSQSGIRSPAVLGRAR
jgi:hypothetical protein